MSEYFNNGIDVEEAYDKKDGKKEKKKKSPLFIVGLSAGGAVLIAILLAFAAYLFIEPTFSLKGEKNAVCQVATPYKDAGYKASFLGIDIANKVSVEGKVDNNTFGDNKIYYTLVFHGKKYTLTRTVSVVDTMPPRLELKKNSEELSVSAQRKYEEPGYSATDNYDGDITDKVETSTDVHTSYFIITYRVTDSFGNESTAERKVLIRDKNAPNIKLNGESDIDFHGVLFTDPGFYAKDDADGDVTKKVKVTTDYEERKEGTFTFTYEVSDSSGNKRTVTRTVRVSDTEAPELTLVGAQKMYLCVGDGYYEAGAKAMDAFEGEVNVEINGAPDTNYAGTYTVVYSASDSKGNSVQTERTVTVMEKPTPVDGGVTGGGVVSDSTIFLTFDDGPSYITPEVLDILKSFNVKATFFIINYSDANKAVVNRAINEGHTIGIHGFTHDYQYIYTSPEACMENIKKLGDKLKADFGYSTNLTRFPGGSSNTISRRYSTGVMAASCALAESLGYNYFDWNISSGDAAGGYVSANAIYNNVVTSLAHGRNNIVLMHDSYGKDTTAEALRSVIEYGLANGYTFAGLSSDTVPVHHPINN